MKPAFSTLTTRPVANIVVSAECGMKCSYCFARDELQAQGKDHASRFISLDDFVERLDFLDRSDIREARLIGGEPTLHPLFPELIRLARERGKRIVVFSHGLISTSALECLAGLRPEECSVIVNTSATRVAGGPTADEDAARLEVLKRLQSRALLGFTFERVDVRMDHLLPLILETGCRKRVRLGLSQPAPSGLNTHLNPKQYPALGRRIAEFAAEAAGIGVRLGFDCGFVRCMFSVSEIATLRAAEADLDWRCNAVLDIDLTGQALHCFPLAARLREPVDDSVNAGSLRSALAERARPFRLAGVYRECSSCSTRADGGCSGGCLAVTMRRFRTTQPQAIAGPSRRSSEGVRLPRVRARGAVLE